MKFFRRLSTAILFCLAAGTAQTKSSSMGPQTALLLIDIQNDYFPHGTMTLAGADEASLNARRILERFRTDSMPVIHIRHIAARPGSTFFLAGTPGSEIHSNVRPLAGEKVVIKHFPNSFRETELLDYLKQQNIDSLVVCGMMTHMCVDATVRAAKDYGFLCALIGDACATRDLSVQGQSVAASDVHRSFLAALNGFYAAVITADQYLTGR